jgi:hypothetical protein
VLIFTPRFPHFDPQLQKHLHAEHPLHIEPRFRADRFQAFTVFPDHDRFMRLSFNQHRSGDACQFAFFDELVDFYG